MKHILVSALVAWMTVGAALPQEPALKTIELAPPRKTGGMPIQEALAKRATCRAFDTKEIKTQQLSDLLWAAFGINRPDGKRTAPSAMDTGFISQNVYLFCASEGLATGVRGWVDRETLGKRLGLRPDQSIAAAQSVGYPKP